MTAQFGEIVIVGGRRYSMCSEPLAQYFALSGRRPGFEVSCTALWRGYVGTWEIVDGRLYLAGLDGALEDGTAVTIETLFPGTRGKVFADWYCGTLRIPEGDLLEYVHSGHESRFERDRLMDVESGIVVRIRVRENARGCSR